MSILNKIKPYVVAALVGSLGGLTLSYVINAPKKEINIIIEKVKLPIMKNKIKPILNKEVKLEERVKETPKEETDNFDRYVQYTKLEKSFNYEVKSGDTLNRISQHFFTLYTGNLIPSKNKISKYHQQLKHINKINSDDIVPNQLIKIFPPKNLKNYKNENYSKNINYFLKLSEVLDRDSFVMTSEYASSRYHPTLHRRLPHEGIDLVSKYGSYVKPLFSGKVIFTGRLNGYGNTIIIESKNYEYLYAHLASIKIKKGRNVKKGDIIGIMGSSGETNGPHLHLSVSRNKHKNEIDLPLKYSINPFDFVAKSL